MQFKTALVPSKRLNFHDLFQKSHIIAIQPD